MAMVGRTINRKLASNLRTFSRSCIRRESSEKLPATEKQEKVIDQSHLPPVAMRLVEPKDRLWLYFGSKGKYKSRAEIPKHVTISELMTAQSRVRIKVSNYMMATFLLIFLCVSIYSKHQIQSGAKGVHTRNLEIIQGFMEEGAREREAKKREQEKLASTLAPDAK